MSEECEVNCHMRYVRMCVCVRACTNGVRVCLCVFVFVCVCGECVCGVCVCVCTFDDVREWTDRNVFKND